MMTRATVGKRTSSDLMAGHGWIIMTLRCASDGSSIRSRLSSSPPNLELNPTVVEAKVVKR